MNRRSHLRFILIGERFFHNFLSLEIIGGMYHIRRRSVTIFLKFSRTQNIKFVNIPIFGKKKPRKWWKIEKLREKNVENLEKKLTDKNDFYFPALLVGSFTLNKLLDKPWSQVSSLLPPGTCLLFLSRIGFSIPTARRFSSNVANSRSRAFR